MARTPEWVAHGEGRSPTVRWSVALEAPLLAMQLAKETGEVFAADNIGTLYRIDRDGKLAGVTHGKTYHGLAWSETGQCGAALLGEDRLCLIDRHLVLQNTIELSGESLAVAVDAHGDYVAVSETDSRTVIYDPRGKVVQQFISVQPLVQLHFCATRPEVLGVGQFGLLTSHQFHGKANWQEKLYASVGDMAVSGDDDMILLACFAMGLQCHDSAGAQLGSYQLGSTISRVGVSFSKTRIAAVSIERNFYWLTIDGQIRWQSEVPEDVSMLECDPLGAGVIIGFQSGRLVRLDWE